MNVVMEVDCKEMEFECVCEWEVEFEECVECEWILCF